ncbi:MAG TPA: FAD:protein FMN transferase, partial [Steroidobacteraceae bacterium]|nr:FAD:protein FMN transferase [Steroidobacteraceae bacterium]
GGPCEVLADVASESVARTIAESVAACAWRIERKFSRYRADNIVARINTSMGAPVQVDDETANLLDYAELMHHLSDGLFDITSGVLRRAWTFDGGTRTPQRHEIDALLPLVGWSKLRWQRPFITLRPGMQIDFGGIGKEYAVDQATKDVAALSGAAVLVNFGGDLAVTRARDGDEPWRVGIEGIGAGTPRAARLVDLKAGALATSGDTYRYVEADGQRLPHILDPRDGSPVRGAPHSITVAAPTCTHAGMLTTLAMLRGAAAEAFLEAEGVRHWIQRQ